MRRRSNQPVRPRKFRTNTGSRAKNTIVENSMPSVWSVTSCSYAEKKPVAVRKSWSRPDSTFNPSISAYLRSKMQCAAPVSALAIRSTDWLPQRRVTGTSIPSAAERSDARLRIPAIPAFLPARNEREHIFRKDPYNEGAFDTFGLCGSEHFLCVRIRSDQTIAFYRHP
jgi:hypothetical protein